MLCKADDQISLTDVLAYIDEIINDPEINNPFFEIFDFSNTTIIDFGYYQSDTLMAKLNHFKSLNNYQGSLLIIDSDYLYGIANIFKVVGEDKEITVKNFKNLDEAVNFVPEYFA